MRKIFITISLLTGLFLFLACASRARSQYPSYQRTQAKYAPEGALEGVPVGSGAVVCPEYPGECDCPRVWYDGHWVYHCDGRWIYWHHGYWYHYPHFHVYYHGGTPHVHRGPTRSIRQK